MAIRYSASRFYDEVITKCECDLQFVRIWHHSFVKLTVLQSFLKVPNWFTGKNAHQIIGISSVEVGHFCDR